MYWWMLLFLPTIMILVLGLPTFFFLKMNKLLLSTLSLGLTLFAEYFIYVYWTSDKHIDNNGVINAAVSLVCLLLFFGKDYLRHFRPAT
jgi:hypothetical protein